MELAIQTRRALRPPSPAARVSALIRRMASENSWGAPRIHGELLRLGFDVSERSVSRCLRTLPRTPRASQTWTTFLRNHRNGIAAMDFFLGTYRDVPHPSCAPRHSPWSARGGPLRRHDESDCCLGPAAASRGLSVRVGAALHDLRPRCHLRGRTAGGASVDADGADADQLPSPWQNGVAERFVGTVRQELLDHVIVLNERHLRRLLESFIGYYNQDRTHLSICKDSPCGRPVEQRPDTNSKVVSFPRVGGLHHRYTWRQAA